MNMNKYMKVSKLFAILIAATMMMALPISVLADYEPNDDFGNAEYTYDGAMITGDLDESMDPYDYYAILLSSGNTLNLELSGTGTNFDLFLYTPDEIQMDSSEGPLSNEAISYQTDTYGTHYFAVAATVGSGTYTINADVSYDYIPPTGGEYFVNGDYVPNSPLATLPTLNVGDSAYFGGVKDIGEEFNQQIDDALAEIEGYGIDVKYDISGGVGAYFGWEIASNSADVDGTTCYDIALTGAIAVDVGLSGSADGSVTQGGYTVTVDGSADGFVTFEATLDGHLYLTVDELAIAKLTLTLKAEAEFEANVDVSASMSGQNIDITAEASGSIDNAQLNFELTFDPPMDIFQFGTGNGAEGIYEGKQWYVPGEDTTADGSITASGTVTYDVYADMGALNEGGPVDESDTINLADEIGNPTFSEVIPGGEGYYGTGGGIMFECTNAAGSIFIIETSMGDAFGMIGGTRQFDDIDSMIPTAGMQFDSTKGMITGMTVGGEAMTETVTEEEVTSFTEDPLGEVTSETGGHSGGMDSMLIILVVVIVVVVVVVVVVMVVMRKKTPPPQQYPPQQPMYGPQPGYEQPPPQYPPPQQYPPQQGQYPPPPPPPGQ